MSRLNYQKGVWIAKRDFDLPNLRVEKGKPLPDRWTVGVLRKYLFTHFGKKCIEYVQNYYVNAEAKQTVQIKKQAGKPFGDKKAVATA